jgi:hypothetical protein
MDLVTNLGMDQVTGPGIFLVLDRVTDPVSDLVIGRVMDLVTTKEEERMGTELPGRREGAWLRRREGAWLFSYRAGGGALGY